MTGARQRAPRKGRSRTAKPGVAIAGAMRTGGRTFRAA